MRIRPTPGQAIEFLLLYLLLPVGLWAMRETLRPVFLPVLWTLAVYALVRLKRQPGPRPTPHFRPHLKRVLLRCAIITSVGTAGVLLMAPERFLAFPRSKPGLWAAVMVLYPLLSVLPQAWLFRAWFHTHHDPWLGGGRTSLFVGAACFAWAHLFFHNPVAIGLTFVGGLLFADTWRRSQSLGLSVLEHALYGNWVFTVGLGQFLYAGTVQSVERLGG